MSAAGLSSHPGTADIVLLHGWGMTPAVWAPIESLLGEDLSPKLVEKLRKLDIKDPALLDILYRTGEALGAKQLIRRDSSDANPKTSAAIAPDWPPAAFDPWRPAAPVAAEPAAETPPAQPPQA